MREKKIPAIHPILFTLFPILFLFSKNLGGYALGDMLGVSAKAVAATLAIWFLLARLVKSGQKAGIVVTLAVLLFSSYGRILDILHSWEFAAGFGELGIEITLGAAFAVVFAAGAIAAVRTRWGLSPVTTALNVAGAALVIVSAVRIGTYEFEAVKARRAIERELGSAPIRIFAPAEARNIYYIVLDGFGRPDKLRELYGTDVSEFVAFLQEKGFYVAGKSTSNYSNTLCSMASSLNCRYLPDYTKRLDTVDAVPLAAMREKGEVVRLLRSVGYKFVCFDGTGDVKSADIKMHCGGGAFEEGLMNTTAYSTAAAKRERKRSDVLDALRRLPETARMGFPVFVYAHIMAPHPPFVFRRDGADATYERFEGTGGGNYIIHADGGLTRGEYIRRYGEQLEYICSQVPQTIDGILAASEIKPIIIVQGDHGGDAFLHPEDVKGSYLGDRISILNAYYLPEGGAGELYESITPVNTFRVIFRHYFGAECELLPERNYCAPGRAPLENVEVTGRIGSDEDVAQLNVLLERDYF